MMLQAGLSDDGLLSFSEDPLVLFFIALRNLTECVCVVTSANRRSVGGWPECS